MMLVSDEQIGGTGRRHRSLSFPAVPGAVATCRHEVLEMLRLWCAAVSLDVVELLLSEIVTNAIVHGTDATACDARVLVDVEETANGLEVRVRDSGTGLKISQADADPSCLTESGRGLYLVSELSDAWGHDCGPEGSTVYFRVRYTRSACDMTMLSVNHVENAMKVPSGDRPEIGRQSDRPTTCLTCCSVPPRNIRCAPLICSHRHMVSPITPPSGRSDRPESRSRPGPLPAPRAHSSHPHHAQDAAETRPVARAARVSLIKHAGPELWDALVEMRPRGQGHRLDALLIGLPDLPDDVYTSVHLDSDGTLIRATEYQAHRLEGQAGPSPRPGRPQRSRPGRCPATRRRLHTRSGYRLSVWRPSIQDARKTPPGLRTTSRLRTCGQRLAHQFRRTKTANLPRCHSMGNRRKASTGPAGPGTNWQRRRPLPPSKVTE